MRAGRLDQLITIQRKSVTASDSGDPVESWNTIVGRRAASVGAVRGEERFVAPQIVAQAQLEFRIRWSANVADLAPRDRIVYPALSEDSPEDVPDTTRIYDVQQVNEIGRREGLQIIALQRTDIAAGA